MTPGPRRRTTALALGGGGARGLAHVGVLEVLAENGLAPDRVVGVSVGSIVGAAYAFEPDLSVLLPNSMRYLNSPAFRKYVDRVEDGRKIPEGSPPPVREEEVSPGFFSRLKGFWRAERVFHRMLTSDSLLDGDILKSVVENVLPDADVADAAIPLTIVALDLITGREVEITRGPLRTAVLGSASLPGIFPPVKYGGCLLADVGVLSAVPCHAAKRTGVDAVVAVDVTQRVRVRKRFTSAVEVLLRMEDVAGALFRDLVLQHADVIVRPDVAGVDWTDFSSIDSLVAAGRQAARIALPELEAAVRGDPMRSVS